MSRRNSGACYFRHGSDKFKIEDPGNSDRSKRRRQSGRPRPPPCPSSRPPWASPGPRGVVQHPVLAGQSLPVRPGGPTCPPRSGPAGVPRASPPSRALMTSARPRGARTSTCKHRPATARAPWASGPAQPAGAGPQLRPDSFPPPERLPVRWFF